MTLKTGHSLENGQKWPKMTGNTAQNGKKAPVTHP
jgi:hypothetical protein